MVMISHSTDVNKKIELFAYQKLKESEKISDVCEHENIHSEHYSKYTIRHEPADSNAIRSHFTNYKLLLKNFHFYFFLQRID